MQQVLAWFLFGSAAIAFLASLYFQAQAMGAEGMPEGREPSWKGRGRRWISPVPEGRRFQARSTKLRLLAFGLFAAGFAVLSI